MKKILVVFIMMMLVESMSAQSDSLNIFWKQNPESNIMFYRVQRAVNSLSNFSEWQNLSYPDSHAVDHDVQPGNSYAYRVAAINVLGLIGEYSDPASVALPSVQAASPTVFRADTMFYLGDCVVDADDGLSSLDIQISNENHVQVSREGDYLRVTASPAEYSGIASFDLYVSDSIGFWDQKTITIQFDQTVLGIGDTPQNSSQFSLLQNYPNPFNPTTTIQFYVPVAGKVRIELYDIMGNRVRTIAEGFYSIGEHKINLDASALPSGVYFYRMQAGKFSHTRKMTLLK